MCNALRAAHFVHCTACCSLRLGTIWNSRRLWTARSANGTPQALELRAAPYPYSKMCELCELCELFVKKLLLKVECAILPDGALLMYEKRCNNFSMIVKDG